MNEDEILERMRDIQMPQDAAAEIGLAFALWPFAVLGGLILLVLLIRFLSRNRWRRAARAELARIAAVEDPGTRWSMLLGFSSALAERIGRPLSLPETAFRRPETIGQAEREQFVAFLHAEIRR